MSVGILNRLGVTVMKRTNYVTFIQSKFVSLHVRKAYRGKGVTAPFILTFYICLKHDAAILMRIHERVNAIYIHVHPSLSHFGFSCDQDKAT
jgi:hypothetical protein